MKEANVSVREMKSCLRRAVKLSFNVPQTSLQNFSSVIKHLKSVNLKVGRKSVVPVHLETQLDEYLIEMAVSTTYEGTMRKYGLARWLF